MSDSNAEDLDRRLAVNLRALRERIPMSQSALAAAMTERGVPWHQQTVGRVEAGQQQVRHSEAVILAEVLRVPAERLTLPPAELGAMEKVISAASGVDNSALYVSRFAHNLLIAREKAEAVLTETEGTQWMKVRALREVLAERLPGHTLEAAIAEGVRRFREKEDPEAWMKRGLRQ